MDKNEYLRRSEDYRDYRARRDFSHHMPADELEVGPRDTPRFMGAKMAELL